MRKTEVDSIELHDHHLAYRKANGDLLWAVTRRSVLGFSLAAPHVYVSLANGHTLQVDPVHPGNMMELLTGWLVSDSRKHPTQTITLH